MATAAEALAEHLDMPYAEVGRETGDTGLVKPALQHPMVPLGSILAALHCLQQHKAAGAENRARCFLPGAGCHLAST